MSHRWRRITYRTIGDNHITYFALMNDDKPTTIKKKVAKVKTAPTEPATTDIPPAPLGSYPWPATFYEPLDMMQIGNIGEQAQRLIRAEEVQGFRRWLFKNAETAALRSNMSKSDLFKDVRAFFDGYLYDGYYLPDYGVSRYTVAFPMFHNLYPLGRQYIPMEGHVGDTNIRITFGMQLTELTDYLKDFKVFLKFMFGTKPLNHVAFEYISALLYPFLIYRGMTCDGYHNLSARRAKSANFLRADAGGNVISWASPYIKVHDIENGSAKIEPADLHEALSKQPLITPNYP